MHWALPLEYDGSLGLDMNESCRGIIEQPNIIWSEEDSISLHINDNIRQSVLSLVAVYSTCGSFLVLRFAN